MSTNLTVNTTPSVYLICRRYTSTLLLGRITVRLTTDGFQVHFMCGLSEQLTVILIAAWWLEELGRDCQ